MLYCKHSDYTDNDAHFLPGPASPMQECFWKLSLLGKITNALRIPAGATAQATASNRSRLAANTLERTSTNLKV